MRLGSCRLLDVLFAGHRDLSKRDEMSLTLCYTHPNFTDFIVENGYLIADEGAFVLEAPVLPLLRL